jgi:Pyruvate/2-oxoacid:ferredoxin oxidoreductase delta subunit
MCEFCVKHGEGEKWYLQAKNYSDDLLSDLRRRRFIKDFFSSPDGLARQAQGLKRLDKSPQFIRSLMRRIFSRKMKKVHFGQVVPLEEIEQIFGFVNSIVRVACHCRHATLGQERRYCYGISLAPDMGKFGQIIQGLDKNLISGPAVAGMETLTKDEAVSAFHAHEQEGLCHTVWTFHTPFIGGICNCDRSDCLAMRSTVTHTMPVMFRGEYVAQVDPEKCAGCRKCMGVCQFGAVTYSAANNQTVIDQRWCYGCGVCRARCKKEAIRLVQRAQVPVAANLW